MATFSQDIQDKANSLGITPDMYTQIAGALPGNVDSATYQLGGQGNQGWNQVVSSTSDQNTYNAVAQQVRLNRALGGSNTQQQQPTQPTYSSVDQNPMYDLSRLGASALGEQEIVNAVPGPADKKSGIGTVNQPQISKNKVTAPAGPWSTMPGVFGKQGTQNQQGSAPANTPALDTIGSQMSPTQFSDVANQIRNGSTNYVTVNGKPYTITGENINHITSSFPQQTSQWTQTAPQTTPIQPTKQATGATLGGSSLDFGTQVANNAIQQEIQRQLSQGNAYASTGTGIPAGWKPDMTTGQTGNTGRPQGTVTPPPPNPVQTNVPPPAPVNTSNAPGQPGTNIMGQVTNAISGALSGIAGAKGGPPGSVGAFGAAGGGAASDWNSRFNNASAMDATGLSHAEKMQMLGQMNAGADAAKSWAQNAGNSSFKPIASAIPGPEDFRNQNSNIALAAPRVV